jgi:hypothetical protein
MPSLAEADIVIASEAISAAPIRAIRLIQCVLPFALLRRHAQASCGTFVPVRMK